MAFKATLTNITPQSDGTGIGVIEQVTVMFTDDATGFTSTKMYNFPVDTTIASARNTIQADGSAIKAALATIGNLQSLIGTVITI